MRAVGVIEFGGPEALQVVDLPEVHAGPGEVRLRKHAVGLNVIDSYDRKRDIPILQLPAESRSP